MNVLNKSKQNYYNQFYLSITDNTREQFWLEQCSEIDFFTKPIKENIFIKQIPLFINGFQKVH